MNKSPSVRQRRSIRLPEYDYAQCGAYFVTIVSYKRFNIFGDIRNGNVILSKIGEVVTETWLEIATHFPQVNNDVFVVMPNHIHGILIISTDASVGAQHAV